MDDNYTSLPAWLAFSFAYDTAAGHCQQLLRKGTQPATLGKLITKYRPSGSHSDDEALITTFHGILSQNQIRRLRDAALKPKIEQALDWQNMDPRHHLLGLDHPSYPAILRTIENAPPLLYAKGDLAAFDYPALAIVGSRKASRQAIDLTYRLSNQLAARGIAIVSGLARGIDAAAHEGALAAGGRTIAVAATEPDSVYPKGHANLAARIIEQGGLVVTEYSLGSATQRWHFPKRNRIISGLSMGVLVAEASLPSGTLTTATHALEQGREVMAVPGLVSNPQARGCHNLIKNGAALIESEQDILEALSAPMLNGLVSGTIPLQPVQQDLALSAADSEPQDVGASESFTRAQSPFERQILEALQGSPATLDELMTLTEYSVSELSSGLGMLEIEGRIMACAGGRYTRC